VWLYGTAVENSYTVAIDGNDVVQGQGATDGVLFGVTDLTYGLHTITLTVVEGEVSITGAVITVGMGSSLARTLLQSRNISATTPNLFSANQDWSVEDLYANQTAGYPCITTSTLGATLSFALSDAVGFMIYGSDDWAQGLFNVSVTSDDPGATDSVTDNSIQYSPRAMWSQLDLPKYLAAGLNQSATYQVKIANQGAEFQLRICGCLFCYGA